MSRLMLLILVVLFARPVAAEDAVGRLNLAGYRHREMCTASLVAPDRALTAAHCVTTPQDGYLKRLDNMIFVAGWNGADHTGAARVVSVAVHPDAYRDGRFDLRHDLAVVTLASDLPLPPLPIGNGVPPGPFTLMGYRRSAPHKLSVMPYCYGADAKGLWRLRCRVEQGQSGGPVFAGDGRGRRIVAVIVAVAEEEALVVPVDGWLRRQLATGAD